MLLIHGFGGDKNNWLFNHDELAANRRVYAIDLPGHGASDKHLSDPTLEGFADLVLGFLDALGVENAHLVGHSFGGAIAMTTAGRKRERIHSLTLISSCGLGPEIDVDYLRGFAQTNSRKELRGLVRRLFANEDVVTRQLVDDLLRFKRLDGVSEALNAILKDFLENDHQRHLLANEVAQLGIPIRVIWGREDKIIPAAHAEALSKAAEIHVIPSAGHMVQMESPSQVNQLLAKL